MMSLRQFLGLASYSRIHNRIHLSLKYLLTTAPLLAYPQFGHGEEFILETYASFVGLGAVLSQKQDNGLVHPVAFASRSLQSHERNYSSN